MSAQRVQHVSTNYLFLKLVKDRAALEFSNGDAIFSQGEIADSVFYVRKGRVKLAVVSAAGKEAVIAIFKEGDFFGEGSLLAGRPVRLATATSLGRSIVSRVKRDEMLQRLKADARLAEAFVCYIVAHTARVEGHLVDQLLNSTEKRLARILLVLASFGKDGEAQTVIPKLSQETLAHMVGASRSRVSSFLNKFRKLGYIEYNGGFHVHSSLLNVVLHD